MNWLSSLASFISKLFDFSRWFTDRKDAREDKANTTWAAKTHEKNSADIDASYPK